MNLSAVPRRVWLTVALALLVGVVVAALALTASSDPSSGQQPRVPGATTRTPSATHGTTHTAAPDPSAGPSSAAPSGSPSPGSLDVVPAGHLRTEPPVPLGSTADFGTGVALRVTRVEPVRGVARGPGEIAGPAVRMTFTLVNHGSDDLPLDGVVVAVSYGGAHTPATALTGPGVREFGGTLGAGDAATGRYVFAIPEAARGRVRVVTSYGSGVPAVALVGAVR